MQRVCAELCSNANECEHGIQTELQFPIQIARVYLVTLHCYKIKIYYCFYICKKYLYILQYSL